MPTRQTSTPLQVAMNLPRRTLERPAHCRGITLFTGRTTSITIRPAEVGVARVGNGPLRGGIEFLRVDLPSLSLIRAHISRVVPEMRRTVLSADPSDPEAPTIQTVEHLLSALAGLGVTDAIVEIDGPEIPIADGSAFPFVQVMLEAGVAELPPVPIAFGEDQTLPAAVALVRTPIVLEDGPVRIEAHPTDAPGLELEYHLDYPAEQGGMAAPIPAQSAAFFVPLHAPAPGYAENIAPARTFCLAREAQAMRGMGMFNHLTPREMLVIGEDGPIENVYRFPDEPARHKLLDMLGDLSLAGRPIQARIRGTRSGHAHNHALARLLEAL